MREKDVEMIIKAIDTGLREFADENIYLIPVNNSSSSLFGEETLVEEEPIQIYGLIDFKLADFVEKDKRQSTQETFKLMLSLKALRERNLVDNDIPIIKQGWLVKYKDFTYAVDSVELDNPVKDKFLTCKLKCSLLRR